MGKKQTAETYGQVKTDQGNAGKQNTNQQEQNDNETTQAGGNIDGEHQGVSDAYSGLASGNVGSVGNVNDGKVSTSRFDPIYSAYGDLAKRYGGMADHGGFSDESRGNIMGDVSGLRSLGANGGYDSTSTNRARGGGVYDEFANNGGLSLTDRANIKARALAPISSNFKTTNDELARRRAVQGGFAPGFDAATRGLQRDTARNAAATSLDANLGITDRVNQGRLQGAQGMADTENNYQNTRTGNMYRGLMGASNTEMGMNNSIFGNQMSALSGEGNALGGMRGTAGDMAGIDTGNVNRDLSTSEFNAGTQGQNLDRSLGASEFGTSGMSGLYGSDMGRYENALDRGNSIVGQGNQINQGYYGARNPLAMQPGVGGNLMQLGSGAMGAAAGVFTGGASNKLMGLGNYTGNQYMNRA